MCACSKKAAAVPVQRCPTQEAQTPPCMADRLLTDSGLGHSVSLPTHLRSMCLMLSVLTTVVIPSLPACAHTEIPASTTTRLGYV